MSDKEDTAGKHSWPWLTLSLVSLLIALAAGVGYWMQHRSTSLQAAQAVSPSTLPATFSVVSTTPSPGAIVGSDQALTVNFSQPFGKELPQPILTPAVKGNWTALSPTSLGFVAATPLIPGQKMNLRIPSGFYGPKSQSGKMLEADASIDFQIAPGTPLLMQQLLAQAGYLPLSFTPAVATPSTSQLAVTQPGRFTWRWTTLPTSLSSLWLPGQDNVVSKGALMAFQDQAKLTVNGIAGPETWAALIAFVAAGSHNLAPYDYVQVKLAKPQSVTVWGDGVVKRVALANTGVPGADTRVGTFPVYQRYLSQTMRGTNPDGSTYVDPGILWISYFDGGEALHAFPRPGYGYPQSNGCVEMTDADAKAIWPMTPYGTLVTVS